MFIFDVDMLVGKKVFYFSILYESKYYEVSV